MATSIAHDSHNIVVLGVDDEDMLLAVEAVAAMGGGLAVVANKLIRATMPLPIAGLMSVRSMEEADAALRNCVGEARALGVPDSFDPFMTMSFLALPVVPGPKLTDLGLVMVKQS